MNDKLTIYGIGVLLALATLIALAPASTAEDCRSAAVDLEQTAEDGRCQGIVVEIGQDADRDASELGAALGEALDNTAVTASDPCWYVILMPRQVGPVEVAVYQCDPDVQVHEDWDPREDPIYQDWYGNEITLSNVTDPLTQPAEHCWHLGAEVSHAKVDAGPCQDRVSTDEDDPDNAVVYFGYSEYVLFDGPR